MSTWKVMPNRRLVIVSAVTLIVIFIFLTFQRDRLHLSGDDVSRWRRPPTPIPESCNTPNDSTNLTAVLPEYDATSHSDNACSRYSSTYLNEFHAHAATYCDGRSLAELTCFHRYSASTKRTDSMCYAQGAKLNSEEGKFQLDCSLRELSQEDLDRGLLPLAQLPGYWYETGPANIFRQAIDVREPVSGSNESTEGTEAELQTRDEPGGEGNATSAVAPPKNILLLKREGEGNPWHCLMEIFSAYMTFDVLRMSAVPGSEGNKPLFTDAGDSDDTQVVILDEREDGPYFDLWTLFARRKPLRLRELLSDPVSSAHLSNVNLVVPLAGSSNPFWQGDEKSMQCNESPILEVFVRRVLDFYAIPDPPFRTTNQDPIAVTFVQRSETRRLHNQRSLFAELQRRNPRVRVQMVDFAAMSFSEQVRIARQTDVLVGVHGAGLTHSMFMRKGAGAVVEIQPRGLDHNGFRNVAGKLGLGYFRTHVDIVPLDEWEEEDEEASADHEGAPPQDRARTIPGASRTRQRRTIEARDEWHTADVVIDEDRFFRVVEPAVEFMYTKGPWDYDTD